MSATLILRAHGWIIEKRYALELRYHGLGGTDYSTVCYLTGAQARAIAEAAPNDICWLFGEPDFAKHAKELELRQAEEKAAKLREELKA